MVGGGNQEPVGGAAVRPAYSRHLPVSSNLGAAEGRQAGWGYEVRLATSCTCHRAWSCTEASYWVLNPGQEGRESH